MIKISLPAEPDLIAVLDKVKGASEDAVTFLLPPKPEQWNVLSLRTLASRAASYGKKIEFVAQDRAGEQLLATFQIGNEVEIAESAPASPPPARLAEAGYSRLAGGWRSGVAAKIQSIPRILRNLRTFLFLGAVFLAVVVGGLSLYFFQLSRATITLVVNTSPLVKTLEVIVDPSLTVLDLEKRALPAVPVTVTEEGDFEGRATGEKEVGTKAQGEVTVYNYDTGGTKSLAKDSVLVTAPASPSQDGLGGEELKFLLAEEVQLKEASSSVDPKDPTRRIVQPDMVDVKVAADGIGPSYNLKSETRLDFTDLETRFREDIFAKAASDFSGGSEKKVSVVRKEDQDKLLAESLEALTGKCTAGLSGKLVGDQKLEVKATQAVVAAKDFSEVIGEEAEVVGLNLKVDCQSLAYSESQLQELLAGVLEGLVPNGYRLSEVGSEVSVLTAEKRSDGPGLIFQVKLKGEVTPEIDLLRIKESVAGRGVREVGTYFTTLPNINSYRIQLYPPLPQFLGRLPFRQERIEILLSSN